MTLGVRGRLMAVSTAILMTAGLASGALLERELRDGLGRRIEDRLVADVGAVREALGAAQSADADALVDRLGRALGARVTLIAPDGRVLGDSERSGAALGSMDNHGQRPEVLAAAAQGLGVARRYSTTLGDEMLYVALPYAGGAVRASVPLTEIGAAVRRLRSAMALAGLAGLAIALFMSGLASHLMAGALRDLVGGARALREGRRPETSLPIGRDDELGSLARSLRLLSDGRRRSVEELDQERDRLNAVLGGMRQGVLGLDDHRVVRFANDSAQRLLGLAAAPVGRPLTEIIRHPAVLGLLGARGAQGVVEFDVEGSPRRWLTARLTPEPASSGAVLVLDDLTELRLLQRVREDFVANVSHELRTPIAVIQANTETLLDGALQDPEVARAFLRATHSAAVRMGRLASDLLSLASIEAKGRERNLTDVDVATALHSAVDATRDAATAKRTVLTVQAPAGLAARAEAQSLDQVLLNLVDNAVKYTPDAGHVWLTARLDGDQVRIEVADDGPGIAPVHEARIFERFYRVDAGRSRSMGGTGLGLSIVKHLVEGMGGQVGVGPAEAGGARFWVLLPAP